MGPLRLSRDVGAILYLGVHDVGRAIFVIVYLVLSAPPWMSGRCGLRVHTTLSMRDNLGWKHTITTCVVRVFFGLSGVSGVEQVDRLDFVHGYVVPEIVTECV